MKAEIGYIIVDKDLKGNINSIKHGKGHCIKSWLINAPFGNWNVAKEFGYKCKKIKINIEFII